MVTHIDRNIIDRTLGLLTKISCDMQEVLKSAPIYNIGIERLEIQRIKDQYLEVTAHLQNTYYFIFDNWEKAESNPIFRHEIWLFTNEYNKFKDTVITLASLILDRQITADNRPQWIGPRNEGTLFAEHFKLSQKLMNSAFLFTDRSGNPSPLQMQKDKANNIAESYGIWQILQKYRI